MDPEPRIFNWLAAPPFLLPRHSAYPTVDTLQQHNHRQPWAQCGRRQTGCYLDRDGEPIEAEGQLLILDSSLERLGPPHACSALGIAYTARWQVPIGYERSRCGRKHSSR
eukprot:3255804-Rhodomonas_salina.2